MTLNGSISIFDNYDMFMINYDVVVFHKDVRGTQLPTAFYFNFLYVYACSIKLFCYFITVSFI